MVDTYTGPSFGPSLSPAPSSSPDEVKKRRQAALQLLKQSTSPEAESALIDPQAMLTDPDYRSEVKKIQLDKYGTTTSAGKWKKDGDWKLEAPTNVADQFAAGVLRPFEKMGQGPGKESMMEANQIPDEDLTKTQKVANVAGEVTGYGIEYAPVMKGVKAAGVGAGITKNLVGKQVAKTAAGELVEGGIKGRLKSYVGKKVIGNMVDDAIAGGLVGAAESRGDPTATVVGAVSGAVTAPANQYLLKPAWGLAKQALGPVVSKFTGNLHNNIKEGVETLTEQQVKESLSDPKAIAKTIGASIDDTVDDVVKTGKAPEITPQVTPHAATQGTKTRGFVETIKTSPRTVPEVAHGVSGTYNPLSNKATLEAAKKAIQASEDDVLTEVLGPAQATADKVAKAQLLIDKFSNEGKHEQAIQVVENIAKQLTAQGQSIQAASMWNRLTPAGILKTAERTFANFNAKNPDAKKPLRLTKELSKKLTDMAEAIKDMPEGAITPDGIPDAAMEAKNRATLKMLKVISDKVPTSLAKKIDTIQTLNQLLNTKTVTRNVIGNSIFGAVDNAQQTLAAGLDKGVSLVTGKRSMLAPNPIQQAKGAAYGLRQGFLDAWQGIDTANAGTVYDIPTGSTFKSKWNPLHWAEKGLNISLRTPDRAFYEAAKRDYLKMAEKLAKINGTAFNIDDAMQEADLVAKYRTFQDDTAWAEAFKGIKNSLNVGKEFGLGSFIMKYPKTPANLLARAVDYSPVSFVRAIGTLGKTWFRGQQFNQAKFVTDLSKGLTGTGLIGMGYYLSDLGIISGAPTDDKDIAALERQEGAGRYRVNVTALKRFIDSGFDPNAAKIMPGDKLATYDWAQPVSTSFAIGANAAQGAAQSKLDKLGKVTDAIMGGVDSLYEQPLLSGVAQVFRGGSVASAAEVVGRGMLSSFAPTLVSQINQYNDNTARDPYDPNPSKYAMNLAKAKVPGLAQELPQSYDVWGQPMERYKGGSNTFANVFFNPAFVATYQPTPESQLVIDLFSETGETKHAPMLQDRKIRAYGFQVEPSAKTLQAMQSYSGQRAREMYKAFMASPEFMALPAIDKAKELSNELQTIGADTKLKFLGNTFLALAEKGGDPAKIKSVSDDLIRHATNQHARDLYDNIKVMTKEERAKFLQTLPPSLAEKIKSLRAQDLYKEIKAMTPGERADALQELPDSTRKRVQAIYKEEQKKHQPQEFKNLQGQWAAEYIYEEASKMSKEERAAYIKTLKEKGILKIGKRGKPIGVYKKVLELKEQRAKIRQEGAQPYKVPIDDYLLPAQEVQ